MTGLAAPPSSVATPADVSNVLVRAYPRARGLSRLLIRWRPYICPFHELLKPIPRGSTFIDIGCGVGLMSVLLAHAAGATRLIGIDTSASALATARDAIMPGATNAEFLALPVEAPWPAERVDGVVCIDVLHHVPVVHQREFIRRLARLNWSGKLFFKDVSPRPFWKAAASQLHDLLIARQWIHIPDERDVKRWLEEEGLVVTEPQRLDMLWYSHYFLTAERA